MSATNLQDLKEALAQRNDLDAIVNEFGDIKAKLAELEAVEKIYNAALKDRLTSGQRVIASKWSLLKSSSKDSQRLDAKRLEADLGKDTLAGYYNTVKGADRLTIEATKLWETAA